MSAALPVSTRIPVVATSINTGILSGPITIAGGAIRQVIVEVDGATSTFYTGSGFTVIPGDSASSYLSSMGFLISVFWQAPSNAESQFVTIDQGVNGGAAWNRVRKDLVIPGVPYYQRGIPIGSSFARVTLGNGQAGGITGDLSVRVTTL